MVPRTIRGETFVIKSWRHHTHHTSGPTFFIVMGGACPPDPPSAYPDSTPKSPPPPIFSYPPIFSPPPPYTQPLTDPNPLTLSRANVLVRAKLHPASKARRIMAELVVGVAEARPKGFWNLRPHISTLTSTRSTGVKNLGRAGLSGTCRP